MHFFRRRLHEFLMFKQLDLLLVMLKQPIKPPLIILIEILITRQILTLLIIRRTKLRLRINIPLLPLQLYYLARALLFEEAFEVEFVGGGGFAGEEEEVFDNWD